MIWEALLRFRLWRARRRERPATARQDATDLIASAGDGAYHEAPPLRMRKARAEGDKAGCQRWSNAAVEIADRTGYEIGVDVATRG